MNDRNLLDLAQLIAIWVLALQYLVNNFGKRSLERYLRNRRGKTAEEAAPYIVMLVDGTQVVVVSLLLAAAVLGAVGWFDT